MTLRVITPPATLGMLGGGQLGRFTLMAARAMGYRTVVLDPDPGAPAGAVADEHLVAGYDDVTALDRMAVACDVVTTEFENPPALALDRLAGSTPVAPSPRAVAIAQDRRLEKAFLEDSGFPVAPFQVVDADSGLADVPAVVPVDHPSVLKTARLGYDGKGQREVGSITELHAAWAELGGVPCVLERALPLDAELSVVVARTADARVATYPVAENLHVNGILDLCVVPSWASAHVLDRAVGLGMAIADALDYVGVLAVEFFVVNGELIVNELAPRPHNSGHWTLDAARTSQFEQQVRAVCGLGLGATDLTAPAVAMVNLLGQLWDAGEPDWAVVLDHPRAKLHLYGKDQPRAGRKMGHLTVVGDSREEVETEAVRLRSMLSRG
ncbi:MAG: 5-(carboxyamino)imidazole ribonucleotide synthase [Ilumatobacter sp.]|nr:MAG: 5-(carboxyamino)imidazole ribonucleotide synthase [Ilumatobacter sp.]